MTEVTAKKTKGFSLDWLVQGVLTKVGDIFDRLTGRGWKPSSTLATSEIIEKLKALMDTEAQEGENGRKYVPHNIRLKMQWDKFSTDSDATLTALENELLVAAIDHINDRHYFTYAPLAIAAKADYFTSGVQLLVGFEKLKAGDEEAGLQLNLPDSPPGQLVPPPAPEKLRRKLTVNFKADGKEFDREFEISEGERLSVGRTKENNIAINDTSVSKTHASLLLDKDGRLIVADTGSTNGTFLKDQRIPYGKAFVAGTGTILFGTVPVTFAVNEVEPPAADPAVTEKYEIGNMTFETRRTEVMPALPKTEAAIGSNGEPRSELPKTEPAIVVEGTKTTGGEDPAK